MSLSSREQLFDYNEALLFYFFFPRIFREPHQAHILQHGEKSLQNKRAGKFSFKGIKCVLCIWNLVEIRLQVLQIVTNQHKIHELCFKSLKYCSAEIKDWITGELLMYLLFSCSFRADIFYISLPFY